MPGLDQNRTNRSASGQNNFRVGTQGVVRSGIDERYCRMSDYFSSRSGINRIQLRVNPRMLLCFNNGALARKFEFLNIVSLPGTTSFPIKEIYRQVLFHLQNMTWNTVALQRIKKKKKKKKKNSNNLDGN